MKYAGTAELIRLNEISIEREYNQAIEQENYKDFDALDKHLLVYALPHGMRPGSYEKVAARVIDTEGPSLILKPTHYRCVWFARWRYKAHKEWGNFYPVLIDVGIEEYAALKEVPDAPDALLNEFPGGLPAVVLMGAPQVIKQVEASEESAEAVQIAVDAHSFFPVDGNAVVHVLTKLSDEEEAARDPRVVNAKTRQRKRPPIRDTNLQTLILTAPTTEELEDWYARI